jgi:hypothetical protein
MVATTIDPLHLIRIMPAQGSGCERTALGFLSYAYEPTFSCEGIGGLFAYGQERGREKDE